MVVILPLKISPHMEMKFISNLKIMVIFIITLAENMAISTSSGMSHIYIYIG